MTSRKSARLMAPVLAAAAIASPLAGCGGSTKTVSIAEPPPTAATAAHRSATGAGAAGATGTTGGSAGTATSGTGAGGTPAATTRTGPAPAFVEKGAAGNGTGGTGTTGTGSAAAGLPAALAVVRAQGYTTKDTSDYHAGQTLRVLIGTGARSNDGYDKRAFFFVDDRYIGTDASSPSAQISVVSQGDTEVTLAYALYRPGDPLCCAGGGQARVRFQLNNGRLVPLDPIPPASSGSAPSRQ